MSWGPFLVLQRQQAAWGRPVFAPVLLVLLALPACLPAVVSLMEQDSVEGSVAVAELPACWVSVLESLDHALTAAQQILAEKSVPVQAWALVPLLRADRIWKKSSIPGLAVL